MLPLPSFVLFLPTFVSALWGMGYGGGGDYKVDTINSIGYKENTISDMAIGTIS